MSALLKSSTLILSLCLSASAIAAKYSAHIDRSSGLQGQTAQLASVTGRITSIQGNTFTLEKEQSQASLPMQSRQEAPKTMTFTVDQNTTVDGKIEVGAIAEVTYREQDGNDIAVSVRVSAPQS